MPFKVALQASPFNRADLFEDAGFEVVEGRIRTEEDMIELLRDADGAQLQAASGHLAGTFLIPAENCNSASKGKIKIRSNLNCPVDR